jgi:inorganic pyrophosphatase
MQDLRDMPEYLRLEIQHFFEVYKDLEPGKSVEGAVWVGRAAAEDEIVESYKRLEREGH